MITNLLDLVQSAFGNLCGDFHLSILGIDQNEVVIRGNGFVLLIGLDRDGLSINYIEYKDGAALAMVDVGRYLVTKRRWIADTSVPLTKNFESEVMRGLSSFARTLREVAPDILKGNNDWIGAASHATARLSQRHADIIRATLTNLGLGQG
jgi:hypothetical protein